MDDHDKCCKRCDRANCASLIHDHTDWLVPCSACRNECDGEAVDWRERYLAILRENVERTNPKGDGR